MNINLIDKISEEIDRLASMADIARIEYHIFCYKVSLDARVLPVQPLVETIVWKTVIGYPNYMVSSKGEVMNRKTKRVLKQSIDTSGYQNVTLNGNNIAKTWSVHIIVARNHIGNPKRYLCIDHIDHDRTNNDVSNLRWCSHSQNNMNTTAFF